MTHYDRSIKDKNNGTNSGIIGTFQRERKTEREKEKD